MPDWIEKYRSEGLEDAQIDQLIDEKKHKYIQKWGNNSRVGVLLNSYNQKTQDKFLAVTPKRYERNGHSINSIEQGNPSARNRMSSLPTIDRNYSAAPTRHHRNKSQSLSLKAKAIQKALDRRQSDYATAEPVDSGHFVTTN